MDARKAELENEARLDAEVKELRKENIDLKQYILALQGEVYGARLAAKYLDKELAGRSVCLFVCVLGCLCHVLPNMSALVNFFFLLQPLRTFLYYTATVC